MALRVNFPPMSDNENSLNEGSADPAADPRGQKEKRFSFRPKSQGKGLKTGKKLPNWSSRNGLWSWILFGVGLILLVSVYSKPDFAAKEIPYSDFRAKIKAGEIKSVMLSPGLVKGFSKVPVEVKGGARSLPWTQPVSALYVSIPVEDPQLIQIMEENQVRYEQENVALKNIFLHWVLPFLVLLVLWRLVFARAFKMGPGAGLMSFGKNKAKLVSEDSKKILFSDVAGCDEAKEELSEIIDFLKTPQKFRSIGGKIPKGILLVGPPGTGKTLLAKAVAGEADVPFFSLSGSEFVEMFVGVGAARVRDLFGQAIEKSPCIIFIDELDAIGKTRSSVSPMGGHDEREQTLNQLLVEMDGFDSKAGVIIMAATNRPETLDPALMRAGRFDRQVVVDKPDIKGREEILKIHSKNVKLAESVELKTVAARTPGFVGADLANVVNEAALLAVRKNKTVVELSDFEDAVDRVIAGLQKKNRVMSVLEKKIVAFHEMGHALVAHFSKGADPVHKVSVIPRGFGALGFTMTLPKEDRYLMTKSELLTRIDILYGGRVAEEVVFNEISTGAQDDIQKATDLAKRMVMEYGMSESCGQRSFSSDRATFIQSQSGLSAAREYSESVAEKIDLEIASILKSSYQRVVSLIKSKRELLEELASVLIEKEVVEGKEFETLIAEFEGIEPSAPLSDSLPVSGGASLERASGEKTSGERNSAERTLDC